MRRLALFGLLLVAGCGGSGAKTTVFAASSLTEAFQALDPHAAYEFAGSDELELQLAEGARADVFASASPKYADELHAKGIVGVPRPFATNRLVAIVASNKWTTITSPRDLANQGVKLVLGAAGVPVGDYARKELRLIGEAAALRNVASDEHDAKGVVAKVSLGEADAGIVYATDARAAGSKVHTIALPPRVTAVYEIAAVRGSRRGRAFVARVLGPDGRAALRQAGFGAP